MPDLDDALKASNLKDLIDEANEAGALHEPSNELTLGDIADESVLARLQQYKDSYGNPTGRPMKTRRNCYLIIRYDKRLSKQIWLDSFKNVLMFGDADYSDTDDTRISLWIDAVYGVSYAPGTIMEMTRKVGEENQKNELVNWLNRITWDKTPRSEEWLIEGAGADDTELIKTMSRCWLIQAVARALNPGVKGDVCLILVGPQGAKKSTLLEAVAGKEYFADTPLDIGSRNAYQQLQRAWIYEVAELDSIRRSHNSSTKAFLSATEDTFVPPYGRHAVTIKRHVCFCGSTNEDTFLRDKTGSRRFWPVRVGKINLQWARENREQLWAEAVHLYKSGAQWWLGHDSENVLAEESTQYEEADPWLNIIAEFLLTRGGSALETSDIMKEALKLESHHMSRTNSMRLHEVMTKLGWVRERRSYAGTRGYYWVKSADVLSFNKLGDL
tara:strand:- start:1141 stop:2466 length:1326 start_codon:yes stop_codon:yes gene_type:complete